MGNDTGWSVPVDFSLLKDVDLFFELLAYESEYTLIPELLDIFGREKLLDFLKLFSGMTFKVPEPRSIEAIAKKTVVYNYYKKPSSTYNSTANKFGIAHQTVKNIVKEIEDLRSGQTSEKK